MGSVRGTVRLSLCGAFAVAALVVAPLCAQADELADPYATAEETPGAVRIEPLTGAAGGEIALRVSGCRADKAVAKSEAFVADVKLAKDSDGLFGQAVIRSTVSVGEYAVTVACAGEEETVQG
ncbi:hypothetical protein ACFU99_43835, partial [Streptomyces sp. NPDC057654]